MSHRVILLAEDHIFFFRLKHLCFIYSVIPGSDFYFSHKRKGEIINLFRRKYVNLPPQIFVRLMQKGQVHGKSE